MTKEKHNQWKKPKVQLTRTKGIWVSLFKKIVLEQWGMFLDMSTEEIDFKDIGLSFVSNALPPERWITNNKVSSLEVEIVWHHNAETKWSRLVTHIKAVDE